MEDPWVNAWGDPQKSSSENNSNVPPMTKWESSSKFITDDQADISIPSWEPDTGEIWDDSSDIQKDLWSGENRVSQLWATPPTLESIGFAKPPEDEPSNFPLDSPPRGPSPIQHETEVPAVVEGPGISLGFDETTFVPDGTHSASEAKEESTIQEPNCEIPVEISIEQDGEGEGADEPPRESSPDPDGFGTFEVAIDVHPQSGAWTPPKADLSQLEQTEAWGTSWKENDEDTGDKSSGEALDEWELAKRQKEMQDRYVPPEVLDSILRHFDEFVEEYWPDDKSGEPPMPFQHTHNELAESLGITAVVNRLIPPDPTLPVPTPFVKTFISKEMIDSLKLTRHHPITRNSPLAVYMNSKGSLSWEAAVKSKPDLREADVIPTGWRIMPKEIMEQQQSTNDTKKKVTGGLLSFFGRKSTSGASVSDAASPARSNTPGPASPQSGVASLRPSVDINIGNPSKEIDITPSAALPTVAVVSETKADAVKVTPEVEESTQTPSAVSRFFGRFARSNRSSNTSARNSIALSSDDLEFLSDIVPNAHDDMDQLDQLDALSNMIRAPPVPSKLPPPLAPPPRAPPLPKPLSPPPFVGSQSIVPTVQNPPASSRPSSMRESIENQLFDLDPEFSVFQPQSKHTSSEALPIPSHQPSSIVSPPVPAPLLPKPAVSRTHQLMTQPSLIAPTQPTPTFDDDDFSDFQASPTVTSAPSMSLDSVFASFTAPVTAQPPRITQPVTFDDFGDLVSSEPPRVPDKPRFMSLKPPTPPSNPSSIFLPPPTSSTPRVPPFKSPSPLKQPRLHDRRSSKQAESHQRTISLLETAAARGKWPAPPSPLPNAIPPPGSKAEPDLFDIFDDEPSVPLPNRNPVVSPGSALVPTSTPASSSTTPPLPPSGNPAGGLRSNLSVNGLSGQPLRAPTVSPPLIPPQFIKPLPSPSPVQSPVKQNSQSQWRIPSPPTPRPVLPSTQTLSSMFSVENNKSRGGSRSGTPIGLTPQQQKPVANPIPSVFNPAALGFPQTSDNVSSNKGSTGVGSGGGKLSAQDLSFFESL